MNGQASRCRHCCALQMTSVRVLQRYPRVTGISFNQFVKRYWEVVGWRNSPLTSYLHRSCKCIQIIANRWILLAFAVWNKNMSGASAALVPQFVGFLVATDISKCQHVYSCIMSSCCQVLVLYLFIITQQHFYSVAWRPSGNAIDS